MEDLHIRPVLRDAHLSLRAPVMADAPSLAEHANCADVARWLLKMPHPYTLSDAQDFIAAQMQSRSAGQSYVICLDDEAIGCIGTKGEFGYWLSQHHWGKGIVSAAARAVLQAHFDGGGGVLRSSHATDNLRSRRVLEKCGFQPTGAVERRIGRSEGQVHLHRMMLLTPTDWAAVA